MIPRKNLVEWSKLVSKFTRDCSHKKCIFPDKPNCSSKVIQGHSIQKSKILEKIAYNGKVMTFDSRMSYVTNDFEEIGIGKASTFFGFCNYHDTKIFSEIENKNYKATLEQNYLFAYRACARQYIERRFAFCICQKIYDNMVINQENFRKIPFLLKERKVITSLIDILVAHLNIFHSELNKNHSERKFNLLFTKVIELPYISLFAVNSSIDINYNNKKEKIKLDSPHFKDYHPIFLNVFPQNNKTFILLSCFNSEFDKFENLFTFLDSLNSSELEVLMSKVILNQCRNMFFSPLKMKELPEKYRKSIISNLINNFIGPIEDIAITLKPTVNLFQSFKEQ